VTGGLPSWAQLVALIAVRSGTEPSLAGSSGRGSPNSPRTEESGDVEPRLVEDRYRVGNRGDLVRREHLDGRPSASGVTTTSRGR
jgi:hypothetical protein